MSQRQHNKTSQLVRRCNPHPTVFFTSNCVALVTQIYPSCSYKSWGEESRKANQGQCKSRGRLVGASLRTKMPSAPAALVLWRKVRTSTVHISERGRESWENEESKYWVLSGHWPSLFWMRWDEIRKSQMEYYSSLYFQP